MKHNVDALLRARHLSRKDLAFWCRRGESWISKIMKEDRREFPMKYWDRISDFFGVATYQLLQPGITALTERRRADRRVVRDRRLSAVQHVARENVSAVVAALTAEDIADIIRMKALPVEVRSTVRQSMAAAERSAAQTGGSTRQRPRAGQGAGSATTAGHQDR